MSKRIFALICMQICVLCMAFSTLAWIIDPAWFGLGRLIIVLIFGMTSVITGHHYRDRTG